MIEFDPNVNENHTDYETWTQWHPSREAEQGDLQDICPCCSEPIELEQLVKRYHVVKYSDSKRIDSGTCHLSCVS